MYNHGMLIRTINSNTIETDVINEKTCLTDPPYHHFYGVLFIILSNRKIT